MALIHDVMPAFRVVSASDRRRYAEALLDKYKKSAWVLAGGMDTFD